MTDPDDTSEPDGGHSCAYCRLTLKTAAVSECPACGALHHAECWVKHGGCAAVDCQEAPAHERRALDRPTHGSSSDAPLPPVLARRPLTIDDSATEARPESSAASSQHRPARRGLAMLALCVLVVAIIVAGAAVGILLGRRRPTQASVRGAPDSAASGGAGPTKFRGSTSTSASAGTSSTSQAATVDRFLVDPRGIVGSLVFNQDTEADVIGVWGTPTYRGTTTSPVGTAYAPGQSLGYGCTTVSSQTSPQGFIPLGPASGGQTACAEAFYINDTTQRLVAFQTADPRFRTVNGSSPGMAQAEANAREGQPATSGCPGGIRETTPTATLILDNAGSTSQSGPVITTGWVSSLSVEATNTGVGIQFC